MLRSLFACGVAAACLHPLTVGAVASNSTLSELTLSLTDLDLDDGIVPAYAVSGAGHVFAWIPELNAPAPALIAEGTAAFTVDTPGELAADTFGPTGHYDGTRHYWSAEYALTPHTMVTFTGVAGGEQDLVQGSSRAAALEIGGVRADGSTAYMASWGQPVNPLTVSFVNDTDQTAYFADAYILRIYSFNSPIPSVPEPASWALALAGWLVLSTRRRRKR
jgi:hypothetical protein